MSGGGHESEPLVGLDLATQLMGIFTGVLSQALFITIEQAGKATDIKLHASHTHSTSHGH